MNKVSVKIFSLALVVLGMASCSNERVTNLPSQPIEYFGEEWNGEITGDSAYMADSVTGNLDDLFEYLKLEEQAHEIYIDLSKINPAEDPVLVFDLDGGSQIVIPLNSLVINPAWPQQGTATLRAKELLQPGQMISERAVNQDAAGSRFKTAGEYYLDLEYEGNKVDMKGDGKLMIYTPKELYLLEEGKVRYEGEQDVKEDMKWSQNTTTERDSVTVNTNDNRYIAQSSQFGWSAIGKEMPATGSVKSIVFASTEIPTTMDIRGFIVLPERESVFKMTKNDEVITAANLPSNTKYHYIAITMAGPNRYIIASMHDLEVKDSDVESMKFRELTRAEIKEYLSYVKF